jgi:hypothetical protein
MVYKNNINYQTNNVRDSLDDIDFGPIIYPSSNSTAPSNNIQKDDALFFNDATETLEFDMHEFPEFMSPPRLLKRDNSDHYLEFSDLSNEEDHEDIDFLQLLLSSPSTNKKVSSTTTTTMEKQKKNLSPKKSKKEVRAARERRRKLMLQNSDDFDILTSTLQFLKIHKENLSPKDHHIQNNHINNNVDDVVTTGKMNNFNEKTDIAIDEENDHKDITFMKSIKCLEGANKLTYSSLLNDKENLRKQLVAKYLKKRTSLLKNAFVKQRILANAYVEKAKEKKEEDNQSKDNNIVTINFTKKGERIIKEGTKMNHAIRKKRKSFDMSSDTNNFNNIFVDNTTMLLKRPCLTRVTAY